MKNVIAILQQDKLLFRGLLDVLDAMNILVMNVISARQLSDLFDRIKLQIVGWEKNQEETRFMLRTPIRMEYCMVENSIPGGMLIFLRGRHE